MSEWKHTPGPWLLQETTVYALNEERIPVNRFTASIDSGWRNEKSRISRKEVEANARLISAAPELLEALELVMDRLVDRHESDEAAIMARVAIAKATGEEIK